MKHLIFKIVLPLVTLIQVVKAEETPKVNLEFYNEIKKIVSEQYVEPIDDEDFIYSSLNGGISNIDPHSAYINPKDYSKFKENVDGEFSGLGIQITQENGFIKVISPIDETPAFNAGVKAGDFITHIDGENTYQMSTEEASSKMRGKEGTKVKIIIFREGVKEPIELTIVRAKIQNKSITVKMLEDIAIVRISSFIPTTANDLKTALSKEKNIKGIIIDVRNNPGGLLDQAVLIANFFLQKDEKIVIIRGRKKEGYGETKTVLNELDCKENKKNCTYIKAMQIENELTFFANGESIIKPEVPVLMLINKGSASASEVLAGALKENARAKLIGELSFGKGVIQTLVPILGGKLGVLKLTTARYYSPKNNAIQAVGIMPDIIIPNAKIEPYENKLQSLFTQREEDLKKHPAAEKLEEVAKQSKKFTSKQELQKQYYNDLQLWTAINIMNVI